MRFSCIYANDIMLKMEKEIYKVYLQIMTMIYVCQRDNYQPAGMKNV